MGVHLGLVVDTSSALRHMLLWKLHSGCLSNGRLQILWVNPDLAAQFLFACDMGPVESLFTGEEVVEHLEMLLRPSNILTILLMSISM